MVVGLLGEHPGLVEQGDAGGRIVAPAERHAERRRRVGELGPAVLAARLRDADRLAGKPLGIGERAFEHLHLGERGEDRRPLDAGIGRDEGNGLFERRDGSVAVAGGPPVAAEPLVEEAEGGPILPLVEGAHHGLDVGGGAGRPARRERGLSGADQQRAGIGSGVVCVGLRPSGLVPGPAAARRAGPVPPVRAHRREGELQRGEGVTRRMDGLGPTGGIDGGFVDLRRGVGFVPVPGRGGGVRREAGCEGQVVAVTLARQQVRDDRPADELVAEVDAVVADLDDAVLDALGQTRDQIRRRSDRRRAGAGSTSAAAAGRRR